MDTVQATNDTAVTNFQKKFAANYGRGAFPWDTFLAAIMALLSGCSIPLTPANIRAQIPRLNFQARLQLKMFQMGMTASARSKAGPATVKTFHDASDDEINSWIAAVQENEP